MTIHRGGGGACFSGQPCIVFAHMRRADCQRFLMASMHETQLVLFVNRQSDASGRFFMRCARQQTRHRTIHQSGEI